MSSKVYMVNNNAEFETTMAVVEIDDEDFDTIRLFISKLNAESKHSDEPTIVISEYKTDTKSKLRGKIQDKIEEWDNPSYWTKIGDTFYLKYLIDN